MRRLAALLAMLSGCHTTVRLDQPLTQLPSSLAWCSSTPRHVESSGGDAPGEVEGIFPAKLFKRCSRLLMDDAWYLDNQADSWSWRGEFGLTTNEFGRLTSICVWGATFGNPKRYMDCLASAMMNGDVALPAGLDKESYFVTFILDP